MVRLNLNCFFFKFTIQPRILLMIFMLIIVQDLCKDLSKEDQIKINLDEFI